MKTAVEKQEQAMADSLRAIAHPVRIRILRLLSAKTPRSMSVTEIQERLGLTQPETSRHLLVMKMNSILYSEKEGLNAYYFINKENPVGICLSSCLSRHLLS